MLIQNGLAYQVGQSKVLPPGMLKFSMNQWFSMLEAPRPSNCFLGSLGHLIEISQAYVVVVFNAFWLIWTIFIRSYAILIYNLCKKTKQLKVWRPTKKFLMPTG